MGGFKPAIHDGGHDRAEPLREGEQNKENEGQKLDGEQPGRQRGEEERGPEQCWI